MRRSSKVILAIATLAVAAGILVTPLPFVHSTRIVNSVSIARPPQTVFAYVTTPGGWPKWHPSSLAVRGAIDHPLAIGEQVTENFRVAGRTGEAVWTVIDSNAPRSWTIAGTIGGRAAGTVRYSLANASGGTQFEREFIYRSPNLLFVLLNRFSVRQQIESESEQAVQQLKQVLESAP